MTPAIEPDEMVTAMRIPLWPAGQVSVRRVRPPPWRLRHRLRGSAAADRRRQDHTRFADRRRRGGRAGARHAGRTGDHRSRAGERACSPRPAKAAASIDAMADIHASADYRQHLAAVLSRRALEKAADLPTTRRGTGRIRWNGATPSRLLAGWRRLRLIGRSRRAGTGYAGDRLSTKRKTLADSAHFWRALRGFEGSRVLEGRTSR